MTYLVSDTDADNLALLAKLDPAGLYGLSAGEVMDVLIHRLQRTNGLDFCTVEQCLTLINIVEEKTHDPHSN